MKKYVHIATGTPSALLAQIKKQIADKKIDTWTYDEDGDFTHSPDQWRKKAGLRPRLDGGALKLELIWPKGTPEDATIRGIYLGRFIEMLVTHFAGDFTSASAV